MSWVSKNFRKAKKWIAKNEIDDEVKAAIHKARETLRAEIRENVDLNAIETKAVRWISRMLLEAGFDVPTSVIKNIVSALIAEVKSALLKRI